MDAVVADAANDRTLFDDKDDDLAVGLVGRVLNFEFNVFEELRVPESLEVAAQGVFVVRIAGTGKDAGLQGVAADAAIAFEVDALDEGLTLGGLLRGVRVQSRGRLFNAFPQRFFIERSVEKRHGFRRIRRLIGGARKNGKRREQERRKSYHRKSASPLSGPNVFC